MDDRLLAHYLAVDREPWNRSPESAYLAYALRRWLRAVWPGGRLRVANVGIGTGEWDDLLGDLAGEGEVTSLDIDPDICAVFAYRQRRAGHPRAARVVCGDLLAGALPVAGFDLVTAVGSTVRETGDRDAAVAALAVLVADRGRLLLHGDTATLAPARVQAALERAGLTVTELRVDDHLTDLPQTFVCATR